MWLILFFLIFTGTVFAQDLTVTPSPSQDATPTTASALSPTEATPTPPAPTPRLFDQYKKDYLFQYGQYQQAYLEFIDKKKVYTKYGTITTQKEKFDAAIRAIDNRNKTFKAYLLSIRVLLDDYKTSSPTQTEKNQIDLKKWEDWFTEQLTVVPVINNEDDLRKWVEDFKEKYIIVQQVIYTALVQHEANLRQQSLNQLQVIAGDIKNNPKIRPESQQWLSSLTVKSDLTSTSLANALNYTKKNQSQSKFSNFYPDSRLELSKANNYLREITSDLRLIVTRFYQP